MVKRDSLSEEMSDLLITSGQEAAREAAARLSLLDAQVVLMVFLALWITFPRGSRQLPST
jgi:hypothetical protein